MAPKQSKEIPAEAAATVAEPKAKAKGGAKYIHFWVYSGIISYKYAVRAKKNEQGDYTACVKDLKEEIVSDPKGMRGNITMERIQLQMRVGGQWSITAPLLGDEHNFAYHEDGAYALSITLTGTKVKKGIKADAVSADASSAGAASAPQLKLKNMDCKTGDPLYLVRWCPQRFRRCVFPNFVFRFRFRARSGG